MSRSERGFTLLEMTVALAMVAVLGASLYASMAIAFRARTSARYQTEAARDAAIALDVVAQELANVLPPGGRLGGAFIGTSSGNLEMPSDVLEFHAMGDDPQDSNSTTTAASSSFEGTVAGAPAPDATSPLAHAPRWVELSIRPGLDPPALVRRVNRNLLANVQGEPVEEVLLTGVRALGLRYFDGYQWTGEWDSTLMGDSLPLAVEVTLELDTTHPNDPGRPYRVTQIFPLACARLDKIEAAAQGGTGG